MVREARAAAIGGLFAAAGIAISAPAIAAIAAVFTVAAVAVFLSDAGNRAWLSEQINAGITNVDAFVEDLSHIVFAKGKQDDGRDETPTTHPEKFGKVHGRKGLRHKDTGEIWERDQAHKGTNDHYEVYRNRKKYDNGTRDRSVYPDGTVKDNF